MYSNKLYTMIYNLIQIIFTFHLYLIK